MKVHFITYSDEVYNDRRLALNERAKTEFDFVHSYDKEWLLTTKFYLENKNILDQERGSGYWLWKVYVILETLNKIEYGDVILYLDCGDTFNPGVRNYLFEYFKDNESLLTLGRDSQRKYTKRDCFIKMDCDETRFHDTIQLEAGIISFKKTDRILNIMNEWLEFSKDENIITDIPNEYGENFNDFIDHRHDQSIITNLSVKYNFNANRLLRKYITCNVN